MNGMTQSVNNANTFRTPIETQLENAKRELLDVGLRNPLLNYRTHSQSKDGLSRKPLPRRIEVVEELSKEVLRLLVTDGRKLTFLPKPESEKSNDQDDLLALLPIIEDSPEELFKRQTDSFLQTKLIPQRLETNLLEIFRLARTLEEERGANNLFLALGLLKWFEAESSQEPRFAPLLLIPVELERSNVRSKFQMMYSGEEITHNHSLAEKLNEFGITLPVPSDMEALDVTAYFENVKTVIKSQQGWEVQTDAVHLAFFSFAKFLMYRDLDPANWSSEQKPQDHPILKALLGEGFSFEPSEFLDDNHLDDRLKPADLNHVLDADSSQTVVIHDVRTGRNLVVEGPPGTGKSQTITNMIADGVARGKRVLFVAEKMAALEVVKRRLDSVGLGDACLELHSHKTNKKAVLAELKHTLEISQPSQKIAQSKLEELTKVREQLNAYASVVNTPMSSSGITPIRAFGELQQLHDSFENTVLPLEERILLRWNPDDLERKQQLLSRLSNWLLNYGQPSQHPFWGSQKTVFTPLEQRDIQLTVTQALEATKRLQQSAQVVSKELQHLPNSLNYSDARQLAAVVAKASRAPDLNGILLEPDNWVQSSSQITAILKHGQDLQQLHKRFDAQLEANSWGQDVREEYDTIKMRGTSMFRVFFSAYRKAQLRLRSLYKGQPDRDLDKQLEVLKAILHEKQLSTDFAAGITVGAMFFGVHWKGHNSQFEKLQVIADWVSTMHQEMLSGVLPDWTIQFLSNTPKINDANALVELENAIVAFEPAIQKALVMLELDENVRFGEDNPLISQPLKKLEGLLAAWESQIPELQPMTRYTVLADELKKEDLGAAHQTALEKPELAEHLQELLRRAWLEAHLAQTYHEHPILAQFDQAEQDALVTRFRELDEMSYRFNRSNIAKIHWGNLPNLQANIGQGSVLKRQFELKARHMPIRKLIANAGNIIQKLKPVFMMSPLSIANFLAPGTLEFDLVIFDEASQVKPADAFGAILRGKQIVVVGDSKQLPPTSFFERMISGEETDWEFEDSATADIPSILGLFRSKNCDKQMLRWHYRSRHESLIAVSNRLFYDNKLVIFPSSGTNLENVGLKFRYLPHTIYDRGGSRANLEEAKAVAQAVFEHIKTQSNVGLGVVTFSMAQQRAIEDQLELLRRVHPESEAFFNTNSPEPFFVKNLENVQGDERDVIFISVGYGFDAARKLTMNFGPVNKKDGEKRLNVLFTRARERCEVFSNFTADQLSTTSDSPAGVRALKTYLHQAQTGKTELPIETAREPDSPFEVSVCDALIARGHAVKTQIGVAGYFIDLAVVHPEFPGRYLLGIECDGATYHSARSARDRDRLRQRVLENLGWKIHRIWSTDYFRHPAREIDRVLEAIERARVASPTKLPESEVNSPIETSTLAQPVSLERHVQNEIAKYVMAQLDVHLGGLELHEINLNKLATWIEEVVNVESPIHFEEAVRRVANSAGVQRLGNRIRGTFERAVASLVRSGRIQKLGDFLWSSNMIQAPIRNRVEQSTPRQFDLICDQEITACITRGIAASFGMARGDVGSTVVRMLGFGRLTENMQSRIDAIVQRLIDEKRLVLQADQLILPPMS
jgi:very-short-patch-repair endonuclease